jgi:hypothetical protein
MCHNKSEDGEGGEIQVQTCVNPPVEGGKLVHCSAFYTEAKVLVPDWGLYVVNYGLGLSTLSASQGLRIWPLVGWEQRLGVCDTLLLPHPINLFRKNRCV